MKDLIEFVSEELLLEGDAIRKFVLRAPYRYKKYKIPKKDAGKFRDIAQPTREIKVLQNLCVRYLKTVLPVHECAMAYVEGSSIGKNAAKHRKSSYLLKMDFENFFPNIEPIHLIKALEDNGHVVDPANRQIIAHLFFYKLRKNSPLRLSIGAPSSPFISNAVMYLFDEKINQYCSAEGIVYTRYADDLTFTTKKHDVLKNVPNIINKVIKSISYPYLKVNKEKTVYSSKRFNRHVTGLVLTNDEKVSIGRTRKRYIKGLVYQFIANELEVDQLNRLRGLLAFVNDVEPQFLHVLENKYGKENIDRIRKA